MSPEQPFPPGRATWEAGDFRAIAGRIEPVSRALLEELEPGPGTTLLDVACGTGNLAIPAARAGAKVTGLDIVPKLLDALREQAAEAGLEIELVEGDAAELPFADDSFDCVTSVFGAMFAPDHRRAAGELVRVCRPGGTVAVCAWTPDGLAGRMFAIVVSHLPPPEEGFEPPVLWGVESHVRDLFAPAGIEPRFERRTVMFEAASPEEEVEIDETNLGPIVLAREALEPEGRWEALRGELVALYADANEAPGAFEAPAEYLMTTAAVPA